MNVNQNSSVNNHDEIINNEQIKQSDERDIIHNDNDNIKATELHKDNGNTNNTDMLHLYDDKTNPNNPNIIHNTNDIHSKADS